MVVSAKRFRAAPSKTIRSAQGEPFLIPDTQGTFGNLVSGQNVFVDTNLPQPRQHLAYFAREFLATDVMKNPLGIREMPYGFDIELTGVSEVKEHKFVNVHFSLLPNADIATMEPGMTPVRMRVTLRKEANITSSNTSILAFNFKDFMELQKQGRLMLASLKPLEGQRFTSFEQISLPKDVIVRIKGDDDQDKQKSIVILSASLIRASDKKENAKKRQHPGFDPVLPIINIREFIENKRQQQYVATLRGFSIGLRGFYMLMFPCSYAIRRFHDMYLQVCLILHFIIQLNSTKA